MELAPYAFRSGYALSKVHHGRLNLEILVSILIPLGFLIRAMKKVISICGSMQFFQRMRHLKRDLEMQDYSVFLPEAEESESYYKTLPASERPALKQKFIDAHLKKIRASDAVLIANYEKRGVRGYIGPNTLMEIAFAYALRKPIFLLEPMAEQPCKDEVDGLAAACINGRLDSLAM